MTERTVRSMAKELAGIFYEDNRTPVFRQAFPTLKHYMRGQWVQQNGDIKIDKPGWLYHVELARKVLASMLSKPDSVVSPAIKERIFDALIEEHEKATSTGAVSLTQRKNTESLH